MNNELKEALRSVLKEELRPVNSRLEVIEQNVDNQNKLLTKHSERLERIEQNAKEYKTILENHSKRFDGIEQAFKDLKAGQDGMQKNIIESLGLYTKKIVEHFDNKTEALNKRVFTVETEFQRLKKQ